MNRWATLVIASTLLVSSTFLTAQVGVNTTAPEQALDVNGKLKIGNDRTEPSPGTLRYAEREDQFQGYTNTGWTALSVAPAASGQPFGESVYGYVGGIKKEESENFTFRDWSGGSAFSTPPPGKWVVITAIFPRPNALAVNQHYEFTIGPGTPGGAFPASSTSLLFLMNTMDNRPIVSEESPLFVLKPGDALKMYNEKTSEPLYIEAKIRGYLIDAPSN